MLSLRRSGGQRISTICVDNGRERIQFNRLFGLCNGFLKSAKAVERAVAIPLMRRGVVWLKFDLSLDVMDTDAGLILDCEYNTDLFDGRKTRLWMEQ